MNYVESFHEAEERRERQINMADVRAQRGAGSKSNRKWSHSSDGHKNAEALTAKSKMLKSYAEALTIDLDQEAREKTTAMFRDLLPERSAFSHPPAFWKSIAENSNKFSVRNADRDYLAAIAKAYAVYDYVRASGLAFEVHVSMICEKLKKKPSAKLHLLKAVLRLTIDYDDEKDGEKTINRRALSRDALAINWLIDKGIASHETMAYQAKHGGGVDKWSRLAAKLNAVSASGEIGTETKKTSPGATSQSDRGIYTKMIPSKADLENLESGEVRVYFYLGTIHGGIPEPKVCSVKLSHLPPGQRIIKLTRMMEMIEATAQGKL